MTHYTVRGILSESIPVLAITVAIGLMAGQILAWREEALLLIPILLVLVPPINNAAGMIGAVLGARVASGLHTGSLFSNRAEQFRRDVAATIILGICTFLALAALAGGVAASLHGRGAPFIMDLALVIMGAGLLLLTGMVLVVMLIGSLSFRMGWDPDNIVIPAVTAVGDILGIAALIAMVEWVGL